MSNIKYIINATDQQIALLQNALRVGSPLDVALKFANISKQTYYYWVSLASIVKYELEKEYAQQQEAIAESGVSFKYIREKVMEDTRSINNYKSTIDAFIEPSKESLMKYRTSKNFKEFCQQAYQIINECDKARSDIVLAHLKAIRESATGENRYAKGKNMSASQWFLERTLPNYFGRPIDNVAIENSKPIEPIKVTFVSSNDKETKDRVKAMEDLVKAELLGEKANA